MTWNPPPGWGQSQSPSDPPKPELGPELEPQGLEPGSIVVIVVIVAIVAAVVIGAVISSVTAPDASRGVGVTSQAPSPSQTSPVASGLPSRAPTPAKPAIPPLPPKAPTKAPTPKATPKVVKAVPFQRLSERSWKLMAKDPERYHGERVVIYGEIFQFDTQTGTELFLAWTGGVRQKPDILGMTSYEVTTALTGPTELLSELVEGDRFRAEVTVIGPFDYETQLGTKTSIPGVLIHSIKDLGR